RQQVSVNKPIYPDLKFYCDRVVLETVIKDHFDMMKVFGLPYERLQFRLLACEEDRKQVVEEALFEFGTDRLRPEAEQVLRRVAADLAARAKVRVTIEGHTDSVGSPDYNMNLSRRRAEAVKAWFVRNNVPGAERFETVGFGETTPLAPNT